jgi:hypothetical protein
MELLEEEKKEVDSLISKALEFLSNGEKENGGKEAAYHFYAKTISRFYNNTYSNILNFLIYLELCSG